IRGPTVTLPATFRAAAVGLHAPRGPRADLVPECRPPGGPRTPTDAAWFSSPSTIPGRRTGHRRRARESTPAGRLDAIDRASRRLAEQQAADLLGRLAAHLLEPFDAIEGDMR